MSKILVISNDVVDTRMAGCGIRAYEISKFLSNFHNVTLIAPNYSNIENHNFRFVTLNQYVLKKILKESEVIILQGTILSQFPFIKESSIPIVVDMYTPFILENLEVPLERQTGIYQHNRILKIFIEQLLAGDYFICANERQKDFFLGMFCILNRINPVNYQEDKTFHKLIDIVPFGMSSDEPRHTKHVLKGVYKNIKADDKVILWLGGIWDWLDSITLIKAMKIICQKRNDIKLIFLGIKHPARPMMEMARNAVELSKKLGFYDRYVFFEEGISYDERTNCLMEANIGIVTHSNHIETRFSHRTRIADYIWTNLPIIATKGGTLSDLIEQQKLGITIDYENADSLADAIFKLLEDEKFYTQCKKNLRNISSQFRWDKILEPLNEFCKNPKRAPDKEYLKQWRLKFKSENLKRQKLKYYFNRLKDLYRRDGLFYTTKYCLKRFHKLCI